MPIRLSSLTLAIATMLAVLASLAVAPAARNAVASRAEPTGTPPSATTRSGCRVEAARDVDRARVGLTETVGVTLTVTGCLYAPFPVHTVLVIDNDLGDAVDRRDAVRHLLNLVEGWNLPSNPTMRAAVVAFGGPTQVLAALTNDERRVAGAIRRAHGGTGDGVQRGIEAGRRELVRGRTAPSDRDSIREVLILITSASWPARTCAEALSAAGMVRGEGILLITLATSLDRRTDTNCLRSVATSPRYFFDVREIASLIRVFQSIRQRYEHPARPLTFNLAITDTIAPAFAVDLASAYPPAADTSPNGRTLRWALPTTMTFPAAAVTVTYRLRPLALGEWPVSLGASAAFTDARGARATIAFPPSSVDVVDPATADARVCPAARAAVPADVIAAALARPDGVSGWGLRCSANHPAGPSNPLRRSLRLARPGMAYHPVANGLVWGCGCR